MPLTVSSVRELQMYVRGVMRRADHHAGSVDEVILAIAGGVLWRAEGELEVMAVDGDMKNVLWFEVGGARYALSYNHDAGTVEVRRGSTRGAVAASFNDASSMLEVKSFFEGL